MTKNVKRMREREKKSERNISYSREARGSLKTDVVQLLSVT